MNQLNLQYLSSPVILKGDDKTAYRDPTVLYENGVFYLFCTMVETEPDGSVYLYTATLKSSDLVNWTLPVKLTLRDKSKNFSSPGNIIRHHDKWVLCLQTYCRENGEKYGNGNCRLYVMESTDLENWNEPRLLRVKGDHVPDHEMGRMIDPYLLEDKDEVGKWWCFYKQNGVSMSSSYDLQHWEYAGHTESGENVCVIKVDGQYTMFHSPQNGIGVLKSKDMKTWVPGGDLITLGQRQWPWAQGRLTAGFVLDCTDVEGINQYLLFFHGTGPENEDVIFDTHACIGIAWSNDLKEWNWLGK